MHAHRERGGHRASPGHVGLPRDHPHRVDPVPGLPGVLEGVPLGLAGAGGLVPGPVAEVPVVEHPGAAVPAVEEGHLRGRAGRGRRGEGRAQRRGHAHGPHRQGVAALAHHRPGVRGAQPHRVGDVAVGAGVLQGLGQGRGGAWRGRERRGRPQRGVIGLEVPAESVRVAARVAQQDPGRVAGLLHGHAPAGGGPRVDGHLHRPVPRGAGRALGLVVPAGPGHHGVPPGAGPRVGVGVLHPPRAGREPWRDRPVAEVPLHPVRAGHPGLERHRVGRAAVGLGAGQGQHPGLHRVADAELVGRRLGRAGGRAAPQVHQPQGDAPRPGAGELVAPGVPHRVHLAAPVHAPLERVPSARGAAGAHQVQDHGGAGGDHPHGEGGPQRGAHLVDRRRRVAAPEVVVAREPHRPGPRRGVGVPQRAARGRVGRGGPVGELPAVALRAGGLEVHRLPVAHRVAGRQGVAPGRAAGLERQVHPRVDGDLHPRGGGAPPGRGHHPGHLHRPGRGQARVLQRQREPRPGLGHRRAVLQPRRGRAPRRG